MATLSKKVAGITLPIDHFGTHLDSQGKVRDRELAFAILNMLDKLLQTCEERI